VQTSTINQAGQTDRQTAAPEQVWSARTCRANPTSLHPHPPSETSCFVSNKLPSSDDISTMLVLFVAFPLNLFLLLLCLLSLLFPFCFHLRDLNVIYQTPLMPMIRLGGVFLHPPQFFNTFVCLTSWKAYLLTLSFISSLPLSLTVFKAFQTQLKDHLMWEILSSHNGDADDSNFQSCDLVSFGDQALRCWGTG